MRENRLRFGKFIRDKRVRDPREFTQAEVAEMLGISQSLYGHIENNARPPFDTEKIEIFAKVFNLPYEEKTLMYDLAAREKSEIPVDLEDMLLYEEIGETIFGLCRKLQNGDYDEEEWKRLARDAYKEAQRRGGSDND